jgi:hypothetical protein
LPPDPSRDDDDEDEAESAPGKTIFDVLAPIAETLGPSVKPFVSMLTSGAGKSPRNSAALGAGEPAADAAPATKPNWDLREFVDFNYAGAKARAKKAALEARPRTSLQERVMSDPKLLSQFMAIKALLTPDEGMKLVALGERMSEQQQESLLAELTAMAPQDAAQFLRAVLLELNADTHNMESAARSEDQ